MPVPGDQHRRTITSPFEEVKSRISEYTAQEVATLQSRLEKQLGPEYISSRQGPGGSKVHYIAGEKCINLANEVFGFNGWSSAIREVTVDSVEESAATGKVTIGLSVIMRITLRDGTYHEDIGYAVVKNCEGKAAAFEKAKKEGTTDALKRTLRNFGNVLGNCLYNKDYLTKVTKLKIAPSKWDADNLYRHADYAPIKKECLDDADAARDIAHPAAFVTDDEFGYAEFDEADFNVANADHPDEIGLDSCKTSGHSAENGINNRNAPGSAMDASRVNKPPSNIHGQGPAPQTPGPNRGAMGQQAPRAMPSMVSNVAIQRSQAMQRPPVALQDGNNMAGRQQHPAAQPGPRPQQGYAPQANASSVQRQQMAQNGTDQNSTVPETVLPGQPVGFFAARVAESVQNQAAVSGNIPQFNPHAESPSIRKTAGVDHTKSAAVSRDAIGGPPASNAQPAPMRTNFGNAQASNARRVGMPNAGGSPLANRGSFKPPQKRPATEAPPHSSSSVQRAALGDVTSASVNSPLGTDADPKRQKTGNGQNVEPPTRVMAA